MINLSADININVDKLLKKMQSEVVKAVQLSAIEMHSKAQDNYAANGSNNTGSQARIIIDDKKLNQKNPIADVKANFQHAAYIEFGTRTLAKVPSEWSSFASKFKGSGGKVSYKALIKWVQQRGAYNGAAMSIRTKKSRSFTGQDAKIKTAAFLITRKINTIGIKAKPFMYPAFFAVRPKFLKRIQDLCNKI